MSEQTALIAGASRGLGLGLARELVGRGWRVIATARDPARAAELAALGKANPDRLRVERLDVDDRAGVRTLAAGLGGARLDLLFVNAGVSDRAEIAELSPEAFERIMLTNALSPVQLALALRDHMAEGGTIAFMSSRMGSITEMVGSAPAYRASKAALNALSRCLVSELGNRRLTVLNFHPGWVRTDMGGPSAPVSVEESVRGIAAVLAREHGAGGHRFLDYQGQPIPW